MDKAKPLIVSLLCSEYDIASSGDLAEELKPAYDTRLVVVDMSNVSYVDSTCLTELVRMHNERVRRAFPPVRLVLPSSHLRHLFELARFDGLWPLYDSLEQAIDDPWKTDGMPRATTR
jgi:anti-anti-sigma factor